MEPLIYVMAILGCGDGAGPCTQARLLPAHYVSAAECQAALPKRLAENSDVPFPTIMADCRVARQSGTIRLTRASAAGRAKHLSDDAAPSRRVAAI